jgi:hypothetical protein
MAGLRTNRSSRSVRMTQWFELPLKIASKAHHNQQDPLDILLLPTQKSGQTWSIIPAYCLQVLEGDSIWIRIQPEFRTKPVDKTPLGRRIWAQQK